MKRPTQEFARLVWGADLRISGGHPWADFERRGLFRVLHLLASAEAISLILKTLSRTFG